MRFDEIGAWSEIKLEIIRKYAAAYSTILTRQPGLRHVYIDAFAGPGVHVSRDTGEFVPGSLLDPYGLQLRWEVIQSAGGLGTVEIFVNFPIMDMNRNVLWRTPERVAPKDVERMTAFWGDDSWRRIAYETAGNLFGFEEKTDNDTVAEAFQERLRNVAGFGYVPAPLPMRNSTNAVVYYLFFASPKETGAKIVTDIFARYRRR